MASGEYSEHAPSLPGVHDLPADIRDLLENYSGVESDDVIGHIVDVVCAVLCCLRVLFLMSRVSLEILW